MPALRVSAAGQVERVGVADGVDGGVHAAALGGLLDGGARVVLGQVHRLGAERLGASSSRSGTLSMAITFAAPAALAAWTAQRPTGPEAEHGRGVAGPQPGLVDRVPAGAHHVAGEQRDVVGHALGHAPQREVRVRDEHLLGLGALERAERLAVAEHAPLVALVEVAAAAEEALAAGRAVAARARGRPRPPAVTPSPAATTVPTNSWPSVKPGSICTRPW